MIADLYRFVDGYIVAVLFFIAFLGWTSSPLLLILAFFGLLAFLWKHERRAWARGHGAPQGFETLNRERVGHREGRP